MSESSPSSSEHRERDNRIDLRAFLPAALAERWQAQPDADTLQAASVSLNNLLDALTTYLPRRLIGNIFAQPVLGLTSGEFLSGTVMFADLSGFTAMSEQLSQLGREGAESVTSVINDFFTGMSDIAALHGGDVVIFGGDAMLLLFTGADHAPRASHAAWQMQQAMNARFAQVKTQQGTFPLRMAIGLGSGQALAAALGSADSMHYTLLGPALEAMGRAEALAGGGRIILDRTTHQLTSELRTEPIGDLGSVRLIAEPSAFFSVPDTARFTVPPIDKRAQIDWLVERIATIVPFLPSGLLPRLLPSPLATLEGEHRPVTILFIDFRDADALIDQLGQDNPQLIILRLNAAFDAVRSIVTRYGGVINKISNGPAGPHVIALFGALKSHEDDPLRAVHAASEIHAALRHCELPRRYPARIGINTGFVYAANVGSRARREYTVMGDQVNLAARLMTVAEPDQIIVSASTAAHVERGFDLLERQPVHVKGKALPQRNYQVQAARSLQVTSTQRGVSERLLGRSDEIAIGYERLALARQGQGQIIALSSEAGVGKSRLAEALAEQAHADEFEIVRSICFSYGGDIPYSTWVEPLRALLGIRSADSDTARRTKLRTVLATLERIEDAPILGEIIGVPLVDSGWVASLEAQARQRRLFDAVARLFQYRAQHKPLMWIIDDAHWIDSASLELLDHLAQHIDDAAVLLLVAYRPEQGWSGWQGRPNAAEIVLSTFDRGTSEMFVAELLGLPELRLPLAVRALMDRMAAGVLGAAPPDPAAFERYWGNPFFAQERIRALIDTGVLARDADGQWRVTRPIESIEMPDTIHGVIMSRIDRLSAAARRALQVASVSGRTFDLGLLAAVCDMPGETAHSLREHLRDLRDLGIAPAETDASGESPSRPDNGDVPSALYVFRNVTTQEVAYASLPYERRRVLHRRIGDFLEERVAGEGGRRYDEASGLLTYHYFEGQVWDKALRYALEAGQSARQKYANVAAAGAYRRALRAAEILAPQRALEELAAHEALADVQVIMGEYDAALRHYQSARSLAESDPRHLAELCRKSADVCERRSEYDEAFNWLRRGLEYATPDSLEAARIYLMGVGVFHRQGKNDQAAEWCEHSLRISRALAGGDARRAEARAQYLLSSIFYRRGDLGQAIDAAQRSLDAYVLVGDLLGQSQALNSLAIAYQNSGDLASATRHYSDGLQLKTRIGDVAGQAMIMLNLGEVYRSRGDLEQARQMFEQSQRIFWDLRYTQAVALLENNLAATAIAEGEWERASSHLDESERLFLEIGSEDFKAELHRHRAELTLGQGHHEKAIESARQALEVAEAGQEKLEIGLARRVLGQVYLALDDPAKAERELLASLEILESVGSRVESANTRVALARLYHQQNRSDEAESQVSSAITTYIAAGAEALKAKAETSLR